MRKIFFLVQSLVIITFFFGCSSPKTSFRKIEISYFIKDTTADSLLTRIYVSINKTGEVALRVKDAGYPTDYWPYYTTHLPDSLLEKLSQLFNSQKKLKEYEAETKLGEGVLFAGDYFYVKVEYNNNTTDSLCTILPFLDSSFSNAYDPVAEFFFDSDNEKKSPPFDIPVLFRHSLQSAYKKTNYLPPISQPPPFTDEVGGKVN